MAHRFRRNAGKTDLKRLGPGQLWEPRELEVIESLLGLCCQNNGTSIIFISFICSSAGLSWWSLPKLGQRKARRIPWCKLHQRPTSQSRGRQGNWSVVTPRERQAARQPPKRGCPRCMGEASSKGMCVWLGAPLRSQLWEKVKGETGRPSESSRKLWKVPGQAGLDGWLKSPLVPGWVSS